MAVMNSACGVDSTAGTFENGRVRSAVHRPDSTRSARTDAASSSAGAAGRATLANVTWRAGASSDATSMTIDCSARISPRWTAAIVPAAGATCRTPGVFLSSHSGVPRSTASPGLTSSVGLRPTQSAATNATRRTRGASPIDRSGTPASGTSRPLVIL